MDQRGLPELLLPAGNFEKMRAAIRYGADAVYLAGERFGMRSAAGNFSLAELREAVLYAHARGVRVYLTVNVMPREWEYAALTAYVRSIADFGIDAFIVADLGVLSLFRRELPQAELHISTQANVVSAETCKAYAALGAKRIVLARELSLEEIRAIRAALPREIELEAFIHGSMCISYSGRCLLSNHIVGRDGNRGSCAQPCRWNYRMISCEITEEKRPDMPIPLFEEGGETFIMASRDTCMIEHIPALVEAGIDSFKIEGRMKSAYYAAVTANTYRMALDAYAAGKYRYDPAWYTELCSVSHREYATGYFFSDAHLDANTVSEAGYIKENAYLATVISYDAERGVALLEQRNKMTLGMAAELLTPGAVGIPLTVTALTDTEGNVIEATPHPYMRFYMSVPFPVREGDILRAARE